MNTRKPPLFAAALAAYREGRINVPPRARTVRDPSVYEQDLDQAEAKMADSVRLSHCCKAEAWPWYPGFISTFICLDCMRKCETYVCFARG